MKRLFFTENNKLRASVFEILIITALAAVPLFITFPYRVNIFLSWEGAYRLSEGQVPYRDFGLPMGFMYWVVPGIFFKIFGAGMMSLVKAQVFLNIISGLAFRSILKCLQVQPGLRLVTVFLFCVSFSFFNFWPWYNHTVIVYELAAVAFLMKYFFSNAAKYKIPWLVAAAMFTFFSFFTKQDGGALTFMLCGALLIYHCLAEKKILPLVVYGASFAAIAFIVIYPFTKYNFGYWFNHGQPPHTSRFSLFDIADEFFYSSQWIKFYLVCIVILVAALRDTIKEWWGNKRKMIFLLLTLGILAEAAVLQVTSYTPPDNNIFFHSFAIVFILSMVAEKNDWNFNRIKPVIAGLACVLLWWSGVFWKYIQRYAERLFPATAQQTVKGGENVVNRKTYFIERDTSDASSMSDWTFCKLPAFRKLYMPASTAAGLDRLMEMDVIKNKKDIRVLNMTELTPLAHDIPFKLETGTHYPLWYHLGVSMFNKEAVMFEEKIQRREYDLVLFEYIPTLNNFYPFRVRDSLLVHYQKTDSFMAPRRDKETKGTIEVFIPR